MADLYKKTKQEFDQSVYAYLVKRLREPIENTDAYGCGFIDERGAETNPPKSDDSASWAYTKLDKLIFFIKSAIGSEVDNLPGVFDWIDSMAIMNKMDLVKNVPVYHKVIGLVEEISYLPPENRGAGRMQRNDEYGLTMEQRLQRAFTCAQFLMDCLIHDGTVRSENVMSLAFDTDVLMATEATFNIRSVGNYRDIVDYLKAGKVIDYAKVKPEGYALAVRIAKALVTANDTIFSHNKSELNEADSWRKLSTYAG